MSARRRSLSAVFGLPPDLAARSRILSRTTGCTTLCEEGLKAGPCIKVDGGLIAEPNIWLIPVPSDGGNFPSGE